MPKEVTQFKPQPDSWSRQTVATRLDKQTDKIVRSLPNRSEWLRRVITEAAKRELMGETPEAAIASKPTSKRKKGSDVDAE